MNKKMYNAPTLREVAAMHDWSFMVSGIDLGQPFGNENIGDSGETIEWD